MYLCCPGDLIQGEYREKLDEMKTEYDRAERAFKDSINFEIFRAVHGIGA